MPSPDDFSPDPLAPNPLAPDPLAPDPLAPDPLTSDPLATNPLASDRPAPAPAAAAAGVASPGLALALASAAFALPLLLSRSTSPSPDHPRVFLWYQTLRQPSFKPPDIAIPLAWTAIETALAVGGYRLLRRPATPARNRALGWLAGNVVAIGAWSRLFFGARNLPASTVGAAALVASGAAYVAEARKTDRAAAVAGIPFVAWVAFATVLTAAIWRKNR